MKYAIFGDIHGRDLGLLEKALEEENPDTLICTGDFDQIFSIRQFMELKEKYAQKEKQVIDVPGNHDRCIFTNERIGSSTLDEQETTIFELHEQLKMDAASYEYLSGLLDLKNTDKEKHRRYFSLDEEKYPAMYNTIVVHGGLDGGIYRYYFCSEEKKDLWLRLRSRNDFMLNFIAMSERGLDIMIRGHDHFPSYAFVKKDTDVTIQEPQEGKNTFRLAPEYQHVITPGPWYERFYATIDTRVSGEEYPVLEFKQVKP